MSDNAKLIAEARELAKASWTVNLTPDLDPGDCVVDTDPPREMICKLYCALAASEAEVKRLRTMLDKFPAGLHGYAKRYRAIADGLDRAACGEGKKNAGAARAEAKKMRDVADEFDGMAKTMIEVVSAALAPEAK